MILYWYIFRKCLFNTIVVLFAFTMLFGIFTLLGELGNLGHGDFTISALLVYVFALVPNFAYLLMPLSVLIGVMIAMLGLVTYSEYAIIRTSGMSLRKITIILSTFGIFFTIITFSLGEIVSPYFDHFAKSYKMIKLKQVVSTNLQSGIWSRDNNNTFVNIKQVMPDDTILGVNIYYYNEVLELVKYINANEGDFDKKNKSWTLKDVTMQEYDKELVKTTTLPRLNWDTSIDPSYFSVLVVSPEEMSIFALLKYIDHLSQNNQSIRRYEIAFWSKLLYPFTCLSMAMLAIAFIPNNRRNVNLGGKLFVGILIGVAFFFATKLINYMAVLFAWNPVLSSVIPLALLFVVGWSFIIRHDG